MSLDGVERKLSDRDLMICSAERPMCIGGVFGGLESGVGDDTTDIFLESAYFNPVWVRKTAKRHGLNTDSSWRFERGVDPRLQVYALKRAALLFKELAGGRISSDIVEVSAGEPADFVFDFSPARSNALIGKELSEQTYRTILDAHDVKILDEREGVWRVAVPPYRVDVQREADLVEEVLRIYGHRTHGLHDARIPGAQHAIMKDNAHARNNQPPYNERTQTGEEGILQTDDVTQT